MLIVALGTVGTTATAFAQTETQPIDTVDEIVHVAMGELQAKMM